VVIFAVGDEKNKIGKEGDRKERYKSHKIVIFHIFAQNPPVSRGIRDMIICASFGADKLMGLSIQGRGSNFGISH